MYSYNTQPADEPISLGVFIVVVGTLFILCFVYAAHAAKRQHPTQQSQYPTNEQLEAERQRRIADIGRGAEAFVNRELSQTLLTRGYIIFSDIILPTGDTKLRLTQIDHLVVSQYGIFCLETKAHKGNIYGGSRNDRWKQYLGDKQYFLNSPFRQNKYHVRAIERILGGNLRAPVHSYIVFPYANKVMVDGRQEDMSALGVIAKILHHNRYVYDSVTTERIAKAFVYLSSRRDDFKQEHLRDVQSYIRNKTPANMHST